MYVQLDADYYEHPKTLHLISLIGPEADTYPPRLWTWALKYAKNGVLRSNAMIEVACRWRGESGKLSTAMMTAGFVDMDGLTLHGWMERSGYGILRYEEKKARKRDLYRNCSGTIQEHSGNIPGTFPEYRRVEDSKGEERRGDTSPSSPLGMLLAKARKQYIAGKADTLRTYFEAWIARSDYTRAEQIIMDPWSKGKTILEIQDHFWPKSGKSNGVGSIEDIMNDWVEKQK